MTENEYVSYVREQLSAQVPPLELKYRVISDCYTKMPIAYRTETVANSVYMGRLIEADYSYATDTLAETGVRLAKWNISAAIKDINAMTAAGRNPLFISVRTPAALANQDDLYGQVKKLINESGLKDPSKLCLEFTQSLLFLGGENARKSILDMKLLGVKTMISGVGAYDCPTARIMEIPVDYCMTDEKTTALANDKDKPRVLPTFTQYLKSMNVQVFADGVTDDDEISTFSRLDYLGISAGKTYQGNLKYPLSGISFEEACAQKEKESI